ncbi:hypothetical protein PoMZ_04513 [Pyricularia oryzae]|uniref:DUF1682 domain-containing protein n=1 Tax=Pyricularia oryzae TaxID=318829 RepID=A0A4P7NC42_PYROR|nr:hypothetical protein PoMZ_04513 [Pyricularia oryzae]
MADIVKNLFGVGKAPAKQPAGGDSDFADFASKVPDPTPAAAPLTSDSTPTLGGSQPTAVPWTKWYNIHERHSLSEFKNEGIVLACIIVVLVLHLIGASMNRTKARKWMRAHAKPLASEFSLVGYAGVPANVGDKEGDELMAALQTLNESRGEKLLREASLFEFATYATGRQNVAFMDVKMTLLKRFNPLITFPEMILSFLIDSIPTPEDTVEATIYPFDGKENLVVPAVPGSTELRAKDNKSTYDNFVWALVNKDRMKELREDRYDVSITFTKDHPKLPAWLSVMTESAEITDALLTPQLIEAAKQAGDLLDYIIVSDQPVEKPTTVAQTTPRKRIILKYRLPGNNDYTNLLPLFQYFVRLPDHLVQVGHFRAEVMRKVKVVRDETIRQIQKAGEDEKAEERAAEREKARKAKRDAELNALDAKAQKKYLEKEREKQLRKSNKRMTQRA